MSTRLRLVVGPLDARAGAGRLSCGLCGGLAETILKRHQGFMAPAEFDVHRCERCDTTFAVFDESAASLYDTIYSRAHLLPGYDRYQRYCSGVVAQQDPLGWLAAQEDVYWAVKAAIGECRPAGSRMRVLEVGCGMGYLTYAFHRAGFDALGVDVSSEAVRSATAVFGNHFRAGDALDADVTGDGYDVVVATELIEHLVDPAAFVRAMLDKLRPGGRLIITTPNRDLYPRTLAWHTDPAPVHRWWLSATSLRFMAQACAADIRFVDFSPYYMRSSRSRPVASKPQSLDQDGRPVFRDGHVNTLARWLMRRWPPLAKPLAAVFLTKLAIQRVGDEALRQSLSYCVVISRGADAAAVARVNDVLEAPVAPVRST